MHGGILALWVMSPISEGDGRGSLGFAQAVQRHFRFLEGLGYRVATVEDTLVRYEGAGRFITVFHGRQSYALGAEFGKTHDLESVVSIKELWNALYPEQPYREYTASIAPVVERGVEELAARVAAMPDVLRGEIPHRQVQEYRQKLTDYYSGKSKISPDRGRVP